MDKHYERAYLSLEERHPWFIARRKYILRYIRPWALSSSILDIGCSGGALMSALRAHGFHNVRGIDVSATAIQVCRARGINTVARMDAEILALPECSVDIIVASDVLEHITNDAKALISWQRVLKPGGIVICFVPAFSFLWTCHDTINHHIRRYTRHGLCTLFRSLSMNIVIRTYMHPVLFLPVLFLKYCSSKSAGRLAPVHPFLGKLISAVLHGEYIASRFVSFPFGTSVVVVAQKKETLAVPASEYGEAPAPRLPNRE